MLEKDLYKKAVKTWGETAQIDMAVEEMAVLTQALCKTKRHMNSDVWFNVCNEISGVQIMLDQLKIVFEGEAIVDAYKIQKLERLEEMLKKEEEK